MEFVPFEQRENVNDLTILACYFGVDPKEWEFLNTCQFSHNTFGRGNIIQIDGSRKNELIFSIQFDISGSHEIKLFMDSAFRDGVFTFDKDLDLSSEMKKYIIDFRAQIKLKKDRWQKEQQEKLRLDKERLERLERIEQEKQQKEKEKQDREKFETLSKKYFVKNLDTFDPTKRLFMILLKLEDEDVLTSEEIEFLKSSKHFGPLAIFYENEFCKDQSKVWPLISACSTWRKAKLPSRALEISSKVTTSDQKTMAALLTTRGGAFRDLLDVEEAEKCGEMAIELYPVSYHAYNLMGAIMIQTGKPEQSEHFFTRAIELGSTPREIDEQIRQSIKLAKEFEQTIVATYLLEKDPEKYKWAEYYLSAN